MTQDNPHKEYIDFLCSPGAENMPEGTRLTNLIVAIQNWFNDSKNPHNEMPKDTVEDMLKYSFKASDCTPDEIVVPIKRVELNITTAYNKGVEALRASIEKEKWTTSDGDKVFSYDDVQEHTERLLKQVSL